MAATLNIEPDGIYDDSSLVLALGLTHATLARARREGHLRFSRKGKRILYLGRWIVDWIDETREDQDQEVPP